MVETSYYWDGLTTGDAALAPYSHDLWNRLWQVMFTRGDSEGILNNIDNELIVSGIAGGVNIATGKSLVDGSLYETDAIVNILVPTPITNPRIDRIVVKKDWAAQTIRIARVAGTENVSPTAPALTQINLDTWEIPLAQALITTAGVITVTDERQNARTRLAPASVGIVEIETFISLGTETIFNFANIPSTFKHLEIQGNVLTNIAIGAIMNIYLNGDTTFGNYHRQVFGATSGAPIATAAISGALIPVASMGSNASNVQQSTQVNVRIPNYLNTAFYKTVIQKESVPENFGGGQDLSIETNIWLNTDAINLISLAPTSASTFVAGTVFTLFGMD